AGLTQHWATRRLVRTEHARIHSLWHLVLRASGLECDARPGWRLSKRPERRIAVRAVRALVAGVLGIASVGELLPQGGVRGVLRVDRMSRRRIAVERLVSAAPDHPQLHDRVVDP